MAALGWLEDRHGRQMTRQLQRSIGIVGPSATATDAAVFYHPAVGEAFDPHRVHQDNQSRKSRGIVPMYLPAMVGAIREIAGRKITDGPKRVYDYLIGRAGANGDCWPGYDRMAKDLGKSKRQIQNDIKFLEKLGLITHDNRAARKSNTYHFIWHPIFEGQWTATQTSGKVRSIARFEWQDPADLSGSGLPPNLYKESPQKKAAAAERTSDSADSIQTVPDEFVAPSPDALPIKNPGEVSETLAVDEVSAALSRNGVAIRTPNEVSELVAFARENGMDTPELARFIEHKCLEKSAGGDPIYSVKFFFRCIPGDVMAFRSALVKRQTEHSPPKFWIDPYDYLMPIGESNV
jgi:hypothetical protein